MGLKPASRARTCFYSMTELHWLIANGAVLLAAALQAATGVGLGLIVGPALILVMGSKSAIQVAIILNLGLSCREIRTSITGTNGKSTIPPKLGRYNNSAPMRSTDFPLYAG